MLFHHIETFTFDEDEEIDIENFEECVNLEEIDEIFIFIE